MGYRIIMNYGKMPSWPRSKRARREFVNMREAQEAIRFEFSRCKWESGTTASILSVKSNGQNDQIMLTVAA